MRRTVLGAIVVCAIVTLLPCAARAERLGWVSADFCRTRSTADRDMLGIGTGLRFASHLPVTIQGQVDGFMARGQRFAEMKVGHIGVNLSDQSWGGLESGYGAGATLEMANRYGFMVQVQGTSSGNLEDGEKLFEVRAGITLRSEVARPEKKFPIYP